MGMAILLGVGLGFIAAGIALGFEVWVRRERPAPKATVPAPTLTPGVLPGGTPVDRGSIPPAPPVGGPGERP